MKRIVSAGANNDQEVMVTQFAAVLSRVLSIRGSAEAERFSTLNFETAPAENVGAQARC